jgi:hypothetical protein
MFEINCLNGAPRRKVKLTVQVEMIFDVGGTDDEDRIDSVREAFDDHYDEMVNNSFWRGAITNMEVEDIRIVDGNNEKE